MFPQYPFMPYGAPLYYGMPAQPTAARQKSNYELRRNDTFGAGFKRFGSGAMGIAALAYVAAKILKKPDARNTVKKFAKTVYSWIKI